MTTRYRLHGLTLQSAYELPQVRPADPTAAVDVVIETGHPLPPSPEPLTSPPLLDFDHGGPWYTLVREPSGSLRFRVHTVCDFVVARDQGRVVLHPAATMEPGMAPIMITGTMLALLLYLRHQVVLHASAVARNGAVIGVMGHSGMGKSTLATILCEGGAATVVTDDVLRLDLRGSDPPAAWYGTSELRLRSGVDSLIDRLDATRQGVRRSVDERTVLQVAGTAPEVAELRALLVPRPNRGSRRVRLDRLSGRDALLAVSSFPRLMGWRDPEVLARTFRQGGELAARVPVLVADVPWGPPFAADLGGNLWEALDSALLG